MADTQAALSVHEQLKAVGEELKHVTQQIIQLSKDSESPIATLLLNFWKELKEREQQLERKEKEQQLERKVSELEDEIKERKLVLMSLVQGEKSGNDSYINLLKEDIKALERHKEEFSQQLTLLWESRLITGAKREEALFKLGEEVAKIGEMQVAKFGEMQAEMRQLFEERKPLTANISQPCSDIQNVLLRTCGLACSVEGVMTVVPLSLKLECFKWKQGSEENGSVAACNYFEEELKKCGVKFGEEGWKLLDVRKDKTSLSTQVGNIGLKGTTDAVIVPYEVARETAAMTIRVVLEWKLPSSSDWASCKGQALAEFIAAYALSTGPLIVVVTDLESRFHILEPATGKAGNLCIARYEGVDPRQAVWKIAEFLRTTAPHADYILDKDPKAAETPSARVSKKIKETVPENPWTPFLSLAEFLPPCERAQLMWEALGSQCMRPLSSEVPPQMYV